MAPFQKWNSEKLFTVYKTRKMMRCEMYTRCLTRNTLVTVHEHVKRLDNTLRQKNKQYVQNNKKLS